MAITFGALGILKYTATVTNTATIMGYQVSLWRTDSNQPVTTIPWGGLETGVTKNTEQVFGFTEQLKIKNVGDYACYTTWKINPATPLSNNVTLSAQFFIAGDGWYDLPQNVFSIGNWVQSVRASVSSQVKFFYADCYCC